MDTTIELARKLKSVPTCRLRLISLAAEVTRADGTLDPDKINLFAKELKEAVTEAQAYIHSTQELSQCLRELAHSDT